VRYDYKALRKLKKYRPKIEKGLRDMIVVLNFDHLMFEAAEKTFEEELARLRKKMDKLFAERQAERKRLQEEVATLKDGELERIGLYHPGTKWARTGSKYTSSLACWRPLMARGKGSFSVLRSTSPRDRESCVTAAAEMRSPSKWHPSKLRNVERCTTDSQT
jgi:hypothetical protein